MARTFFEVFPVLQLNNELRDLFGTVYVLKLSANRSKKYIRIHTHSNRLIYRNNIKQMESQIKDQLFSKDDIQIQLIENYDLSKQYTPRKLFDLYKDCLEEEFKDESAILWSVFS